MSWESKVVWSEGLFLQPHHFQQNDRYVESLVSGVARGVAPYAWGVSRLEIDQELLKLGKFAVKSCAGLTPDGAVFRAPEVEDHPPALDVPAQLRAPWLDGLPAGAAPAVGADVRTVSVGGEVLAYVW